MNTLKTKISLSYKRGLMDGRRGHPPAELTTAYTQGYRRGQREWREIAPQDAGQAIVSRLMHVWAEDDET